MGGSRAEAFGPCDTCSFLVQGQVRKSWGHDLRHLSEMIMLKALEKELVWLLSLTQLVSFKILLQQIQIMPSWASIMVLLSKAHHAAA